MAAIVRMEIVAPTRKGIELYRQRINFGSHPGLQQLERMFGEILSGAMPAVVRVTTDDSTGVSATDTLAPTFASLAAGDTFTIIDPTGKAYTFVGQTSAATLGTLTYRIQTNDATTGANIVTQINAYPGLKGILTAAGTSTVTITITQKGTTGNKWALKKGASNSNSGNGFAVGSANFTGGKDAGQLQSVTATFSDKATANDTIIIGGVTFTCKASPANESEFAPGADASATVTNLTAKVNAHSKCQGLVLASAASGVMTVQLQMGGRVGGLVSTGGSCSVLTWSATSFAPSTTEAYASSLVTLRIGAVST